MLNPAGEWSERSQFINCEFICQLQDDGRGAAWAKNSRMSSKPETFNTRFARLKEESGLSFAALSDAIFARTGMQISHNALHKYMTTGNIDEPTLEALAKYFGKTPAWFRYGIGETPVNTFEVLGRMVAEVPEQPGDALPREHAEDLRGGACGRGGHRRQS